MWTPGSIPSRINALLIGGRASSLPATVTMAFRSGALCRLSYGEPANGHRRRWASTLSEAQCDCGRGYSCCTPDSNGHQRNGQRRVTVRAYAMAGSDRRQI
jgi:hypothetical protein